MTSLWRALVTFLALGLVAVVVADDVPRRVTTLDDRPVAIATLPCDTSLQSLSSGFVVDDRTVVTVAHAIYGSRDHAVRASSGKWYRASIQHLDLEKDLAVLRVGSLRATPVPFGSLATGERVHMLGGAASGSVDGSMTRPVNVRTDVVGGDEKAVRSGYELALEIDPGDSGAAIVDERGRFAAIIFARSTSRPGVAWSTAADEVASVLGLSDVVDWACRPPSPAELELTRQGSERLAG